MKKVTLFFVAMFLIGAIANAQIIFEDDFESYSVDDYVADNSDTWTTWSGTTGGSEDAVISDAFANSPTKSMHISGTNDMLLPLGNQTSGQFDVNFSIYVEDDGSSEGYFNLQHFEAPGSEWASEIFFYKDGTGLLKANGAEITFNYTQDSWISVENDIDIDTDEITLTIEGTEVHTWSFATQAGGGSGTPQLGSLNIYAGADTGTPNFYIDDVEYSGATTALPPSVSVDIQTITTTTGDDETFSLSNVGEQNLKYSINPTYDPIAKSETKNYDLTHINGTTPQGWEYNVSSYPSTIHAGAKFSPEHLAPVIGMELDYVIINIGGAPASDMTLTVYGPGSPTTPGPGEILAQEVFTPVPDLQNTITLTDPVYIDGSDLWITYSFEQTEDSVYTMVSDGGTVEPNTNWTSINVGWSPEDHGGNLMIIGHCTGEATPGWISITPNEGEVAPSSSEDITVSFDPTELTIGETYTGAVVIATNDPDNEYTEIDVTFTVPDGVNEIEAKLASIYPNPSNGLINIDAVGSYELTITNITGEVVYKHTHKNNAKIDLSDKASGIYFVKIQTENISTSSKIVIE